MQKGVAAGFLIKVPKCTLPFLSSSVPCEATNVSSRSQHHDFLQKLQWKNIKGQKYRM